MMSKRIRVRRGSNGTVPPVPPPTPSDEVDNLRVDGVLPVEGERHTLPISGGGYVLNTDPESPPVFRERTSSQEATELLESLLGVTPRVFSVPNSVGVPLTLRDDSVNTINRNAGRRASTMEVQYDIENAETRVRLTLVVLLNTGETRIEANAVIRDEELHSLADIPVEGDRQLYIENVVSFRLMEALRPSLSRIVASNVDQAIHRSGGLRPRRANRG